MVSDGRRGSVAGVWRGQLGDARREAVQLVLAVPGAHAHAQRVGLRVDVGDGVAAARQLVGGLLGRPSRRPGSASSAAMPTAPGQQLHAADARPGCRSSRRASRAGPRHDPGQLHVHEQPAHAARQAPGGSRARTAPLAARSSAGASRAEVRATATAKASALRAPAASGARRRPGRRRPAPRRRSGRAPTVRLTSTSSRAPARWACRRRTTRVVPGGPSGSTCGHDDEGHVGAQDLRHRTTAWLHADAHGARDRLDGAAATGSASPRQDQRCDAGSHRPAWSSPAPPADLQGDGAAPGVRRCRAPQHAPWLEHEPARSDGPRDRRTRLPLAQLEVLRAVRPHATDAQLQLVRLVDGRHRLGGQRTGHVAWPGRCPPRWRSGPRAGRGHARRRSRPSRSWPARRDRRTRPWRIASTGRWLAMAPSSLMRPALTARRLRYDA